MREETEEPQQPTRVTTIRTTSTGRAVAEERPQLLAPEVVGNAVAAQDKDEDDTIDEAELPSTELEIRPIPNLDAFLAIGDEEDLKRIEGLLVRLQKLADKRQAEVHAIRLKHADAEEMAAALSSLLSPGNPKEPPQIVPLKKENVLLTAATEKDLATIKDLVGRLDVAEAKTRHLKVVALRFARADVLAKTLARLLAEQDDVRLEAEPRSNSLLIHGSEAEVAQVERFVSRLDVASSKAVHEMRVFKLEHVSAVETAQVLHETLKAKQGKTASQRLVREGAKQDVVDAGIVDEVGVYPASATNSLIVSAPASAMRMIQSLVEELDVYQSESETKVFTLQKAKAADTLNALESLFPASDKVGEKPLLSFSLDARTNSVLVSGPRDKLEIVEAVILRLEGTESPPRVFKVHPLVHTDALEVAQSLETLLHPARPLQHENSSTPPIGRADVVIVADEVSNAVLVGCPPALASVVSELIRRLDAAPPRIKIDVMICKIDPQACASAEGCAGKLILHRRDRQASLAGDSAFNPADATNLHDLVTQSADHTGMEVLARTSVMAVNKQPATLRLVPPGESDGVRLSLTVAPTIKGGGLVEMHVDSDVRVGTQAVSDEAPQSLQLQSLLAAYDGRTLILGDMPMTTPVVTVYKVPILGRLPILGRKFWFERTLIKRHELVVLLTPRVLWPPEPLARLPITPTAN